MQNFLAMMFVSFFLTGTSGCDSGRVTVNGKVTRQGKPVESGTIGFAPLDGKGNSAGAGIKNGEYQTTKVLPGKKRVQITAVEKPASLFLPVHHCPLGLWSTKSVHTICHLKKLKWSLE